MPQQDSDQARIRLAGYLHARKDEIVTNWVAAVCRSTQIHADGSLTFGELSDHLPKLLDELCNLLSRGDVKLIQSEIDRDARIHGHQRWEHGYQIAELVHEVQLLRGILFDDFVSAFQSENPDFTGDVKRRTKRIIHSFFNDLTTDSVQQFADDRQRELAESNQKLQSLNDSRLKLARTVSHELKNILNTMGAATRLLDSQIDEAVRKKTINIFKRSLSDMNSLVEQLLNYSMLVVGQGQLKIEQFGLRALYDELIISFGPLVEARGLALNSQFDPSLEEVTSDRLRIKQIVGNLLSNAIKYTEHGGIDLAFRSLDAEQWVIVVADTGVGIPAESLPLIFEEFQRIGANAAVHGTGLGLAIAKHLAELLGGKIYLSSTVGAGSRFEVILPKKSHPAAEAMK